MKRLARISSFGALAAYVLLGPRSPSGAHAAEFATVNDATPYQVIADRNMFNLQPAPSPIAQSAPPSPPPKEDLQLTGLCDLFSIRLASFKIVVDGQSPTSFTLAEGAQNEWLEVLSVSVPGQTAKIRIKKPFIRIRSLGVNVLLRFQAHAKTARHFQAFRSLMEYTWQNRPIEEFELCSANHRKNSLAPIAVDG